MSNAIEVKNLTYYYSEGTPNQVAAIKNVNLAIEKGTMVGIIGHTGSGKSTLISHFNGLLKPAEGNVFVDGEDIWQSKETLRSSRFKVGLCFQYPEYQLFEETVFADVEIADIQYRQRFAALEHVVEVLYVRRIEFAHIQRQQ